MTHQKPAGLAPALGALRPANSLSAVQMVTLEPCTKCKQTAVCMPVAGRHGRRSYPTASNIAGRWPAPPAKPW